MIMLFKHEGKYNSRMLFLTFVSYSLQKNIITAKLFENLTGEWKIQYEKSNFSFTIFL